MASLFLLFSFFISFTYFHLRLVAEAYPGLMLTPNMENPVKHLRRLKAFHIIDRAPIKLLVLD